MIKYNRINTEKAKAAVKSLERAKARKGSYNTPEVNVALAEMFYGKCYICENREMTSMQIENKGGISSYQIEHLRPYGKSEALKYDWNNLFWACAHCNNIKSGRYEPILDCSQVEVEKKIAFRKEGCFGGDEIGRASCRERV